MVVLVNLVQLLQKIEGIVPGTGPESWSYRGVEGGSSFCNMIASVLIKSMMQYIRQT